jgi:hypothetical protein
MEHRVITYSGHRQAEEPREFYVGEEHHKVEKVTATWLEETAGFSGMTRQVWRVVDQNGQPYRLTYYRVSDFWEIETE